MEEALNLSSGRLQDDDDDDDDYYYYYYSDIFLVLSSVLSVVHSVCSHDNELLKVLKYGSPTRSPPGSIMRPAATYANYTVFLYHVLLLFHMRPAKQPGGGPLPLNGWKPAC